MKLYKALLELEKSCPELFFLMKNTKIDEIDDKNMTAFAAKTRTGFKIGLKKEWVETFDAYNLAAVIEHELLHIVLEHCLDMDKFKDPELANIAQDYIINNIATHWKDRTKLRKELQGCCFLDDLNKQYGTHFNSKNNTSLEIYEFLLKEAKKQKKSPGSMGKSHDKGMDPSKNEIGEGEESGQGQDVQEMLDQIAKGVMGDLSKPGKGDKKDDTPKIEKGTLTDQKVVGQINKEMEGGLDGVLDPNEIDNIIKAYSKQSGDIRKFFEEIEKRAKNKHIRNAIEKFFSSNKEDFKRSIKKINKRFSFIPYGRHSDKKQRALLALDVSGSMMNPEDLAKLKMALQSSTGNGFCTDLVFGDTRKLGEFKDIKPNFDFKKIHGGGGTDLRFIFKEAVRNYDVVVVVTDGCFDHTDVPVKMKNRILFLITTPTSPWGGSAEVPGFKNLRI